MVNLCLLAAAGISVFAAGSSMWLQQSHSTELSIQSSMIAGWLELTLQLMKVHANASIRTLLPLVTHGITVAAGTTTICSPHSYSALAFMCWQLTLQI